MTEKPSVLLFDNEREVERLVPSSLKPLLFLPDEIRGVREGESPVADFSRAALEADLILVDQDLELGGGLSLTALDGASMVGNFRSWARANKLVLPPLAIITNDESAYANEVPSVGPDVPLEGSFVGNEHRLAPSLDVEWMLSKRDNELGRKMEMLVGAYRAIRQEIGTEGASEAEIRTLLRLPEDEPWRHAAIEHLRRARPPVSEASRHPGEQLPRGPALIVRWLLHRSLSFAGLFLSDLFVAWSLGVTPASFRSFLASPDDTELGKALRAAQYVGPLSTFLGTRWWRAGVDAVNTRVLESADVLGDVQKAFDDLVGVGRLEAIPNRDHVVVSSPSFAPCDVAPIADAVELLVPGWPAEAMPPWLLRSEVSRDPVLMAMADELDVTE